MRKLSLQKFTIFLLSILPVHAGGSSLFGQSSSTASSSPQEEQLEKISAGKGRASHGTLLAFNSYRNAHGTQVSTTRGKFKSPKAAQREWSLSLKRAKRIVERRPLQSASGNHVGQRAVALFHDPNTETEYFAVLWTDGPEYYWISSASLPLALYIEERLNTDWR
jgi:hypothetical protein